MNKILLRKILFEKKQLYLEKEKQLKKDGNKENDYYKEYIKMLDEYFEKLKLDIFDKFSEEYYFTDNEKLKTKYLCLYRCVKNDLSVFEVHDIKNSEVFYIKENDINILNHDPDNVYENMECKFSKKNCVQNARRSYAVPIKFSISRADFQALIDNILDDSDTKTKKL